MRVIAMFGILAAVPAIALARPGDGDAPCQASVTLTRAPDDVRVAVDAWVSTEPACRQALDVSVEAADGGYVVHARDHRGRLRVRIVPDAQTVGVLIASWSADDRLDPEASPPGDRRPASPVDRAAPTAQRMLFSGLAGETYGGRGEIDVFGSRFPVGIVLAGQRHGTDTEFQLLAYVGATMVRQDWQLRVQLGAGIQQTRSRFVTSSLSEVMWGDQADRTLDAITELSLTASRHLVAGWGLTAGIVVTEPLSATEPDRIDSVTWDEKLHAGFYAPIPMALCGISHSL